MDEGRGLMARPARRTPRGPAASTRRQWYPVRGWPGV